MKAPELEAPTGQRPRRLRWRRRLPIPLMHGVAVALAISLAVGCESTASEPEEEPTLSLALGVTSVVVEQGESAALMSTATVGGAFMGTPTISLLGMPGGVSGTVGVPTASGSTIAVPFTLVVGPSVTPATYPITVRASGSGVSDEATLTLTVTAAAQYTLQVSPSALAVKRGSSGTAAVTLARTNFTGDVSLTAESAPVGMVVSFDPAALGGDASEVTVTVHGSVAEASYALTIRGQAPGLEDRTGTLQVEVTAPTEDYSLSVTPNQLALDPAQSAPVDPEGVGTARVSTGQVAVEIGRVNGHSRPVSLDLIGKPDGVTATFEPTEVTASASTLAVSVGPTVAPGEYVTSVRGQDGVLPERTTQLLILVGPTPSYQLLPDPSALTIDQGTGGSASITVSRTSFTGDVTLTLEGAPPGMTGSFDPNPATAEASTLTLAVAGSVATGDYTVTIRGTTGELADRTAEITVTVAPEPTATSVTVHPATIDAVLYNPGMGFTDWFFGNGYDYLDGSWVSFGNYANPPPYPDDYPPSTEAYFRWCWNEIEPVEGQIDFDRFDAIIENGAARSEGERLGFRIMTISDPVDCMPDWLLSKPGYVGYDGLGRHVPHYSNAVFVAAVERLYGALGARYDGHPGMSHIDLGIVGCWGEWNTACLNGSQDLCQIMGQSEAECLATFEHLLDIMMDAFPNTPTIALGGWMDHALDRGAGWRVDCFGDWGMFSPTWSHHADVYPQMLERPSVPDAWQRGPVHLEICWTFPHWYYQFGMSLDLVQQTFDWALDNHASVINGKSTPIPAAYWPIVEDFLTKMGYRLVIDAATHPGAASAGETVLVETTWKNIGVAPPYLPHQVALRLRSSAGAVVVQKVGGADILGWLPGSHAEADTLTLPLGLTPGAYSLDVAILAPDGSGPAIDLAIEGRRSDGWYQLSQIQVE